MKLKNKKTGEIVDTKDYNFKIATPAEPLYGHDAFDVREEYNSLAELNEDWEDVEPAEPLIKDEKIRKAVRTWADGNNIKSVHYDAFWRGFRRDNSSITVWEELPLDDNKVYTIAELCGEEE